MYILCTNSILGAIILKQKRRSATEVVYVFCDTFGMFIPCSAMYFLEVIDHLLLKVATSGPFKCKKSSKMIIFDAIILGKN